MSSKNKTTRSIGFVTLKAAHDYVAGERKYVPLAELKELCTPDYKKPQNWTFLGSKDAWKRSVSPYYHA